MPPGLSSFDYVDDQVIWFGTTGAFIDKAVVNRVLEARHLPPVP
jgi:hypothetical protein